ncbi:peptide deformylase [Candidatus Walczuchella endosymbiont of Icerya purchasi]|uniref:peptide deformylase n=1 Tax=Candidatus Walczuchella endosymbiont of Icerya purchasi TaxID=3066219 RepID=UPI00313B84F4
MMLPISLYGDPVLRKKCKKVETSFLKIQKIINNMFMTMYQANGIGLAAPQVGLSIQLFIVDLSERESSFKEIFINPKIIKAHRDLWKYKEGCLSIPKIIENVERPKKIEIEYYNEHWEKCKETLHGIEARVVQHEYDHLNGKLFIDYLPSLKRNLIKKIYRIK